MHVQAMALQVMAPQMVWEIKRIGISIVSVKKREMKKIEGG
jgi:hypothetical protein